MISLTSAADVEAAFADPALGVPEARGGLPGTVAWLRASVGRFANGDVHARRRALAEAELARLSPDALHEAARASGRPADLVAPAVLAEALGVRDGAVPEDVRAVARCYLTGDGAADAAVARLVTAFGGVADEVTAVRIGLLVQACAATGGLIAAASSSSVEAALTDRPPVRHTVRVALAPTQVGDVPLRPGDVVRLDLAAHPFGSGPRACPGRRHALAIAAGALER